MLSKKLSIWLVVGLVVALAILMVNLWPTDTVSRILGKPVATQADWEGLAKHLTEQGVVEYGAWWCNHCEQQKKMFGDAWQYITYIESSPPGAYGQTEAAKAAGIRAYPTWVFPDGSRVEGVMTYRQLSEKSGYQPTNN